MSDQPQPARPSWYAIDGMTCQNCARKVREAAERVPGVAGATVVLGSGRLKVRWATGPGSAGVAGSEADASVVASVTRAGFGVRRLEEGEVEAGGGRGIEAAPGSEWRFNVVLGGVVTVFLMLAEWGFGWMHARWYPVLAFAVASPVQVLAGARFYRGAWNQLKRGASNMDTLVALGSSAAFGYSAWLTFVGPPGHVYFMESAAIITLISVGHWLEALATARATGAVKALMDLAPATARRLEPDGREIEVAVSDLLPGDQVVLRPGDSVGADAEVAEGMSTCDESMLTGESAPVGKARGMSLYAGTRNLDGRLVARVTATGEGTALSRIMAAVERAQNSRADIQRLADQVSAVFVPVVVVLALLTGLAWGFFPAEARLLHGQLAVYFWAMPVPEGVLAAALVQAISVLIVACPCAMGLATPAAIMAGTNAAALRGILIRDGVALEKAGRIDMVVFDKTGTLTEGRLRVIEVRDVRPDKATGERLESLVGSLARGSSHPVARALGVWAEERTRESGGTDMATAAPSGAVGPKAFPGTSSLRTDLRFLPGVRKLPAAGGALPALPRMGAWAEWRELGGRGIEARRGAGGTLYRLGGLSWLHESGVQDAVAEEGGAAARGAAVTLTALAANERLLAMFELRDALRPESHDVVAGLHHDGFTVGLLTGDGWLAAEAVAREAGISLAAVLADVKPEQKAESLARLQASGRRVAFVGDGINDGPALARADLGIAVARATDVARESADLVLIRGGLRPIREAIGLSQATLRVIRQNLFWAFFYNAAAIPLAMLGFFNPVLCAAAMGLSDLIVIGNALRLRHWRLPERARGRGRLAGE